MFSSQWLVPLSGCLSKHGGPLLSTNGYMRIILICQASYGFHCLIPFACVLTEFTHTHTDKYVGFGRRESGAAAEDGVDRRRSFGKGEEGFTAALALRLNANAGLAQPYWISPRALIIFSDMAMKILRLGQRAKCLTTDGSHSSPCRPGSWY